MAGETRILSQDTKAPKAPAPQATPIDVGLPHPWRIALHVVDMRLQLVFDLNKALTIGRGHPGGEMAPDIDLAPYRADECGVSRRHLTIQLDEDRVVVIDNASSNGTQLNGERLKPGEPYPIRHGDRLMLGAMKLRVEFLTNPFA